jgi:hypothetical protein
MGLSPQAVRRMDNGVRVFYLTADGRVKGTECYPTLGLYDNLIWKEKGRISSDLGITKTSLKKVSHPDFGVLSDRKSRGTKMLLC